MNVINSFVNVAEVIIMHQVHHVGVMVFFGLLHAHLFVLQESTLKILLQT
jgi:hypothetical protein